jgi:hypothetical protein
MKPILPLAAALVALASAGSVADPAAPALRTSPDLAQGVQAFPRLDGNSKAAVAINRALDEADAQVAEEAKSCVEDSDGKGSWNRNVEVTLKSARFISFLAHDDFYCGGPYPDTSILALVYDLQTGAPVDWKRLIPGVSEQSNKAEAADEAPLRTISSPALLALFNEASARSGGDPDCKDALAADSDEPTQLLVWPDANTKGLAIAIPGLPHAASVCGAPVTIPADKLKAMRADAGLIEDIEAASAQDRGAHKRL